MAAHPGARKWREAGTGSPILARQEVNIPARCGLRARRRAHALLALLALLAVACEAGPEPRRRALLIGIDGADPVLTRRLLDQGRLPHLAALEEAGRFDPLRSLPALLSPIIWNTIATGRWPLDHGISDFVWTDASGKPRMFLSSHRRVHALWNMLSDSGLRVGVINWWTTYPPEKIRGVMVSDHALPQPDEKIRAGYEKAAEPGVPGVYPVAFAARVAELRAVREPLTPIADPFLEATLPAGVDAAFLSRVYATDAAATRIALAAEREFDLDLLMLLLPGIDRASHLLWGTVSPASAYSEAERPSAAERAGGARSLVRYYQYTDALIGLLVARYGPDDLVLVVSDHGFQRKAGDGPVTGTHWDARAQDGVLFARGAGIGTAPLVEPAHVDQLAASVLVWFGLPTARNLAGAPWPFFPEPRQPPIESYDDTPIERVGPPESGAEEEILEQLRAVGYIE